MGAPHDRARAGDDGVGPHVAVGDLGGRVVREGRKGALHGADVLVGGFHEKVDVLGRPYETMKDDGEAADQNVACPLGVQRPAEGDEVLELRRA